MRRRPLQVGGEGIELNGVKSVTQNRTERKNIMKIIRTFEKDGYKLEMVANDEKTWFGLYLNDKHKIHNYLLYDGENFGEIMKHFVNIKYNMEHGLSNYAKY